MAILETNQMMFTAFEPKLQNRFLMEIDGIPAYLIKKISRPQIEFTGVVLDHINVKRKIKGKANWENITCDLYDPVTPSGAQAVMEWIRAHHESATGRDGYSDFYKRDILLKSLSPLGEVIEQWKLHGAFITNANFGSLDWGAEDTVNIELTLRYDWALLEF